MKLVLYGMPRACSLVPFITLTEADAAFEFVPVNMRKREHLDPAYLRINPKHKVPALAIDDKPLTENVAIQIWIARHFPQARLLPYSLAQEIQAIELLAWCASGIHPSLTPIALPGQFCDTPGSEDGVRRVAQKKLHENYRIAENRLRDRTWFFDHFTAVDAYFFWCFRRGIQFEQELSEFTHCLAHHERMLARPSVQRALDIESRILESFAQAA